ncbi:MAG TPA: hypothetical protein PKV73_15145 [Agriterribacter sp.]|nr:hypothetical protein [Agriterribacter sp.]
MKDIVSCRKGSDQSDNERVGRFPFKVGTTLLQVGHPTVQVGSLEENTNLWNCIKISYTEWGIWRMEFQY